MRQEARVRDGHGRDAREMLLARDGEREGGARDQHRVDQRRRRRRRRRRWCRRRRRRRRRPVRYDGLRDDDRRLHDGICADGVPDALQVLYVNARAAAVK